VRPVRKDNQGNLWFGTAGGVSKFNGTTFTNYTTNEGLANNDVRHIQFDPNNNIWFATHGGGASKYNGTSWTTYNTSNGLASNFVNKILIESNGTKWFGTLGGGLSRFDGTNWTTYNTTNGLASDSVRAVAITQSNAKFFGTPQGVSKYDGTSWTTINKITSTTPDSVIFAVASSNVKSEKTGVPGSTVLIDSVSFVGVESQPTWLNGDFETWENVTVNMLEGWYTESQNGEGVYRTTDRVAGDFAIELITYLGDRNDHPAHARELSARATTQGTVTTTATSRVATLLYSKDTLTFYYKYTPSADDSASVSLSFKKNRNTFTQMGLTCMPQVRFSVQSYPLTCSSSRFGNYRYPVIVLAGLTGIVCGSRLIIDEIQFKSQPLPNSVVINGNDKKEFTIFPNPATSSIHLNNRKVDGYTDYKIYSISGALVKSGRIYRDFQEIPLNDLGNGVYLFTVKSQSAIVSRKLIVLH
jgi:hypothetical protein